MLRKLFHCLTLSSLVGLAALPAVGSAQTEAAWPSKPITLVVPFPPGGSTDVIARLFATKLTARLGKSIVVDNRPGANTGIGAAAVARATPDGHTLMITGAPTFTTNSLLYPNLGYDPIKSYEHIAIAGSAPFAVLTNPKTGLTSVGDIVKQSKTGELSYGSFGNASTPHLAGEYLAQRTGARLLHVPYRGSAPAMTDLLANQIPLSIDTLVAALPQIRAGKIQALALTGSSRSPLLPVVPTVAESGVAGYEFTTWYGIVAPKGTPAPIVKRLASEIQGMLGEADILQKMRELGFDPFYANGAQFQARVEQEIARNTGVIKAANITGQ